MADINIRLTHEIWNVDEFNKIDGKPVGSGTLICQTRIDNVEDLFKNLNIIYPKCIGTIWQKNEIKGWTFLTPTTEDGDMLARIIAVME